jgi:hypothetical protein
MQVSKQYSSFHFLEEVALGAARETCFADFVVVLPGWAG